MFLDNLNDINQPIATKRNRISKFVLISEISLAVLTLVGVFFKFQSWEYASEILTISLLGLSFLYLLFPIYLFKSTDTTSKIVAFLSGLVLFITFLGALLVIQSWEFGREMRRLSQFGFPIMGCVLVLFAFLNKKNGEKMNFYLWVGLRFVIVFLTFNFR